MDSFEINKIIAAVLVVFVIVFSVGKISDVIFSVKKPNTSAYKVEIKEKTNELNAEASIDVSAFLAMGTIEHGKSQFKKCKACHSIKKGGRNNIGPALWGVMDRNAGGLDNYKYSKALIEYNKKWTFSELNGFLLKPASWIKNNKMGFAGLKKDKDRASIILFLNQNSDNPLPLP